MTTEIYALSDETGVRFIGKAKCSRKRLGGHLSDARRRDTPLYRWIRRLQAAGEKPVLSVLEVTDDWEPAEARWIEQHRAAGARLLNVAAGGFEPHRFPEVEAKNGIFFHPLRKNIKNMCKYMAESSRFKLKIGRSPEEADKHLKMIRDLIEINTALGTLDELDARFGVILNKRGR